MGDLYNKNIHVTFPNDEIWAITVKEIADNKAEYYAGVDGVTKDEALKEVLELFESDDYEIEDWAINNMNFSDFENVTPVKESSYDLDNGWCELKAFRIQD